MRRIRARKEEINMQLPLALTILRTVEEYGRIPKSLLYSRISASRQDIERQIEVLAAEGALKIENDHVAAVVDTLQDR
jgi:hypothetical protein